MTVSNRLSAELSPYLRQHASNPVDWYPWGEEALALARSANRPILLSIGYSACHWCHVMARESFADPAIAAVMNDNFVNIKVDREERPDVDAIYMSAVQTMTGGGGWPLTVFLTPTGEPFYGGTYFPPTDRGGTPSFGRVLEALARAWRQRHDEVVDSAAQLTAQLRSLELTFGRDADGGEAVEPLLAAAVAALAAAEDPQGGFGGAPKFPPHAAIALLQAAGDPAATAIADRALDAMATGGIHDHLGGGFFRYSVDGAWRLPHFEKMLADNAQLLRAYAAAARTAEARGASGADRSGGVGGVDGVDGVDGLDGAVGAVGAGGADGSRHRQVAEQIVAWLVRELAVPAGEVGADEIAFYTATDADSQGEEGRFYAWSDSEFRAVVTAAEEEYARSTATGHASATRVAALTPDAVAGIAADYFGVTLGGTFEGGNVLYRAAKVAAVAQERGPEHHVERAAVEQALMRATAALFRSRQERVRPATDDKVVTSLNGLTLSALAEAGRALDNQPLVDLAGRLARFLRRHVWREGRLLHVWRQGEARGDGLLEDYAFVGQGLLAYYRATYETWALTWAFELADLCQERFADREGGGFFSTADDAAPLLVRPKGQTDGAIPSESVAASELVWWAARYRSDELAADRALSGLRGVGAGIRLAPQAFATGLRLLTLASRSRREVVIVSAAAPSTPAPSTAAPSTAAPSTAAANLADLVATFRAHDDGTAVVLVVTPQDRLAATLPLLEGRLDPPGDQALAYVCHRGACDLPVADGSALSVLLRSE